MGTLEHRPMEATSEVRPEGPPAGANPDFGEVVAHRAPGTQRITPDAVLEQILDALGPGRIARATVAWAIMLEPQDLDDGEPVARELGLEYVVDHTRPGHESTTWWGTYLDVEVQVQTSPRRTTGSDQ